MIAFDIGIGEAVAKNEDAEDDLDGRLFWCAHGRA